jgi:hypothetical protein
VACCSTTETIGRAHIDGASGLAHFQSKIIDGNYSSQWRHPLLFLRALLSPW